MLEGFISKKRIMYMIVHLAGTQKKSILKGRELEEKEIQPNAVDVRVKKLLKIKPKLFEISEESKTHREVQEVELVDGWYNLEVGEYEIVSDFNIEVGEGEAGMLISRSTFNRNGLFITSGLYDSGFDGSVSCVLHVTTGDARIAANTRFAQFLVFQSETVGMYDGSYGQHQSHDEKYV